MRKRPIVAVVVSALVLACAGGCSLFTNLDVDGYVPADAAPPSNKICYADVCLPFTLGCLVNPAECGPEAMCCLAVTPSHSITYACCASTEAGTSDTDGGGD